MISVDRHDRIASRLRVAFAGLVQRPDSLTRKLLACVQACDGLSNILQNHAAISASNRSLAAAALVTTATGVCLWCAAER